MAVHTSASPDAIRFSQSMTKIAWRYCVHRACGIKIHSVRNEYPKHSPDVTLGQRLTDGRGRIKRINSILCDLEPQGSEKLGGSPNGHHLQIELASLW